jgi:hypothetical protein
LFAVRFLGRTANPWVCHAFLIAHGKLFSPNVRRPCVDTEGEPLAPGAGKFFSLFAVRFLRRTTKKCPCRAFLFWRTAKYFPQFMSPKSQIQLPLKKFLST